MRFVTRASHIRFDSYGSSHNASKRRTYENQQQLQHMTKNMRIEMVAMWVVLSRTRTTHVTGALVVVVVVEAVILAAAVVVAVEWVGVRLL